MEKTYPYEHEPEPPLRVENDNAGECFVRGYADAYQGRGLNPPAKHQLDYYKGFVQGLLAKRE
jgi:hypothetical protein